MPLPALPFALQANYFFVAVIIAEMALKLLAEGPRIYWKVSLL